MDEILLKAIERAESPKIVRKNGFVPGNVYGKSLKTNLSVKFNAEALGKVLKRSTSEKIEFEVGGEPKKGIIKEVQKDILSGKILHIDIQMINDTDIVKVKIPVIFEGKDKVEANGLLVEVYVPELEIMGESDLLPENVKVSVSDKQHGDRIQVRDLKLDSRVRILNDPDSTVAAVIIPKVEHAEEPAPEEAAPAETTGEASTVAESGN